MFDTFRKTFHLVGQQRPGRWVAVVVAAVVASGFEMLGAVMVFVLLGLVVDPTGQTDIPVVGDIRNRFAGVDDQTFLVGAAAITLGVFFLLRVVVQVGFQYVKQRMAHNAASRLSSRLAEGYLRLPTGSTSAAAPQSWSAMPTRPSSSWPISASWRRSRC